MDPTTTFCPNMACPARGQTGQGNIGIHARKDRRFICTPCRKTFAATYGTVLYRLRTAGDLVARITTLRAHGCPVHAMVTALGFDERTVAAWRARADRQGQAVQEHLVEQPRDLGQVQADERRVKRQGGIVWMALAMMVSTRLWLAGEVSEQRDMTLIRRLSERVRARLTFATSATDPDAVHLLAHSEVPMTRHVKVQGNRSPYDGDWVSWSTRQGQHPILSGSIFARAFRTCCACQNRGFRRVLLLSLGRFWGPPEQIFWFFPG